MLAQHDSRQVIVARKSGQAINIDAAARWESARKNWDFAKMMILAAAAVDAHNLQRSQRVGKGSLACDKGMSIPQYRKMLVDQGFNLSGMDIDHIVPHSKGGANHPSNYQAISSHDNRSWGDKFGPDKCATFPGKCRNAMAVSRKCGTFSG